MTTKNILLQPELQHKLDTDGYVVVNALSDKDIVALKSAFEAVNETAPKEPFYTSHWSPDLNHRELVDKSVRPILANRLLRFLENYKAIYGYFLVKSSGVASSFRVHQDWSLVDESKEVGITAWCPLVETTSANGAFHVVRGSHRFLNNLRGSDIKLPYEKILHYIEGQFMTPVYTKPGDVILFDQRLWHYSPSNMTEASRVSAGLILIPETAQLVHYASQETDETGVVDIKQYRCADDFLVKIGFGQDLDESKLTNTFRIDEVPISVNEFDHLYGTNCRAPRQIFHNRSQESAFFDKGYFTTPLLTNQQVADCLRIIGALERPQTQGKYNSLEVADSNHRKLIKEELEKIIGKTILSFFQRYKFIGFNAAVKKQVGQTEFPAHLDDIHVNEAEANSVNVWIPLVDVDENNGALYVVPNSHKLPQPIRGIGLPFAFEDKIHLINKHKVSLDLKAGSALVFHTKIIHGSPENRSGKDRPAIICGLIPDESEPIVFLRHEALPEGKVEKLHAPQEFYWNLEFGKKPNGFQSLGWYDYSPISLTDEEFEAIIASG